MDYLKKIKKITNQCIAKKWIDRSPFVGFKMSVNETHKTFLNEEELLRIADQAQQPTITKSHAHICDASC